MQLANYNTFNGQGIRSRTIKSIMHRITYITPRVSCQALSLRKSYHSFNLFTSILHRDPFSTLLYRHPLNSTSTLDEVTTLDKMERTPYNGKLSASQVPIEWYTAYKSCQSYFFNCGQHSEHVITLCAFINIQLPTQKKPVSPITALFRQFLLLGNCRSQELSLIPYIRRLICTGSDTAINFKEFFGSDWSSGIGIIVDRERLNYLYAAKDGSWLEVKSAYDIGSEETVPFLVRLGDAREDEIVSAESGWSEWLAMQDWLLGARRPSSLDD